MNAAVRLFRLFSFRHLMRRKVRFFLAGSSVVLAVALFVSMRVTEVSIVRSFEKTVEALSGKADVQVTCGVGIEQAALAKIEQVGRLRAAPVVQESTVAPEINAQIVILGIDFERDPKLRDYAFREKAEVNIGMLGLLPNAVVIARSFADKHGLALKSTFKVATREGHKSFVVAGILDDRGPAQALGGQLVVMSIANAQAYFGRKGRYDRIEVAFDGATADDVRRALGPQYAVQPMPKTSPILEYALTQQRTVLLGVTIIAILIGIFIIYNSLSLSVVERVKEIGILRALGARRREVVGAFALEAAFVGLVASIVGAVAGVVLSRVMIDQAAKHINLLVYVVDVREVTVPPDAIVLALFVGLVTAVGGAVFPALAAAGVPPMVAIRRAAYGQSLSKGYRRSFVFGVILLALAALLSLHPNTNRHAIVASLVFAFSGLAFMIPQIILGFSGVLRLLAKNVLKIEGYLAVDNIVKFPSRTAMTVIAFAGSLSIIVSMAGTRGAFEKAITDWLGSVFPFDLTVQLQDMSAGAYSTATFPESVLGEIRRDPRVAKAYGVRAPFVPYKDTTILMVAIDVETFLRLRVERGMYDTREHADRLIERLKAGDVCISSNFARLQGVSVGQAVELMTAHGPQSFKATEEIVDYSWPRGVVFLDREVYKKHWEDDALTYIDIRAVPGTDLGAMKSDLARSFQGRYNAYIYETQEVRDHSVGLLHEWFRMADSQILIAIFIGAIGVVNTLLISLITQSRQIGLLRAVGASAGQINASLAIESAFIGLLSGLLGSAMGLFVVKFPMSLLALSESGYAMPFVLPVAGIAIALGAGVAIALLSSTIPIRFTRRISIIESIGYE